MALDASLRAIVRSTYAPPPAKPELLRLRDRSPVTVRLLQPGDEAPLRIFLMGLCPEARRMRFFTGAADMGRAAHEAADRARTVFHEGTEMVEFPTSAWQLACERFHGTGGRP